MLRNEVHSLRQQLEAARANVMLDPFAFVASECKSIAKSSAIEALATHNLFQI
jgi:hypothetical protein